MRGRKTRPHGPPIGLGNQRSCSLDDEVSIGTIDSSGRALTASLAIPPAAIELESIAERCAKAQTARVLMKAKRIALPPRLAAMAMCAT